MSFIAKLQRAKEILEQQSRLSVRALARELETDGDELEELIEELVDVQQVARRDEKVLVWIAATATLPVAADADAPWHHERAPARPAVGHRDARKVVTILFADLSGSTALHERLDPESVRAFMDGYYAAMRSAVEAHAGTVIKLLGDGVMAAFGVPRVGEDDAIRAVRAGAEMQRRFRELTADAPAPRDVGLRVAVNTGEIVVSADDSDIVGDPVNVAARLQEEGRTGDVVIGEATQRLVARLVTTAPLGSFTLKGRSEAVSAYRLAALEPPPQAKATPFVGRDPELARLAALYDQATAQPATTLAVVLGSPGLGKSRLIEEFTQRLGRDASLLSAHCEAAESSTFAPLVRALRTFLGIADSAGAEVIRAAVESVLPASDSDRSRIAQGATSLLLGSPASPEETFFFVRRLLGATAAARPVLLVVDDLHWAEPLLLDLLEHLVQWGAGVPLLILVGARLELRDARSALTIPGGLVGDVITLSGLDAGAATRVAANAIGAADLPAAVAAKVLTASEGNPFFVGELVRMLVHERALERRGDRWMVGAGLAELQMPPTIHALLAARIERLRAEDRLVLERAAVVGRQFSRSAVAELLPRELGDLDARLESLRRSELIERDAGWFLGEPVLRFHHLLIRDAAYRRVLKGTRAELHARFAEWVAARAGDAVEHEETIGRHLEQAHQNRCELGPLDEKGRELGKRACRYLAAAGRRALARDDLAPAGSLLGRALARLEPSDPARAELSVDWCEALLSAGDVAAATAAVDEFARFVSDSERLRALHTCFAGHLTVLTDPQALRATTDAVAAAAETLAALGDAAGEAKAHFVHAQALARLGKVGACEGALDRALAAARRAGDRRRANAVLAGAPLAALWGPSPVTRASGRCLDVVRVLRITQGAPAVEAVALACQGVIEALRGRADAARRMLVSARKMVEELGVSHRLFEIDVLFARIDLLEGDAVAAEAALRSAYEGFRDLRLGIDAAQAAALLGRALLTQGKGAEAEALSHESEALAGDDLKAAIAWRGVRAEALALRGERERALELAEAAVALASATDGLLDHADARLSLAAALRSCGRTTEAQTEEQRATELWSAKGATLLVERAAARGATLGLTMPQSTPQSFERRAPHANVATAALARIDAACSERDLDALLRCYSPYIEVTDHVNSLRYGRDDAVNSLREFLRGAEPVLTTTPLATLGDSLALSRRHFRADGAAGKRFDVGPFEYESISVHEADGLGRVAKHEIFAPDQVGNALVRLYELHAERVAAGAERDRASAVAQTVSRFAGRPDTFDLRNFIAAFAPQVEVDDHRGVGYGTLHGSDAVLRSVRALLDLTEGFDRRVDDVLAVSEHAVLFRDQSTGTDRRSGGTFERCFWELMVFGLDGLVSRWERFDLQHAADAFARFDQLDMSPIQGDGAAAAGMLPAPAPSSGANRRRERENAASLVPVRSDEPAGTQPLTLRQSRERARGHAPSDPGTEAAGASRNSPAARFLNEAWRSLERTIRCFNTRDWEGVVACFAPTHRMDDRRRLMRIEIEGEAFFANEKLLFDVPGSAWDAELLATRGERLALARVQFRAGGEDAGPMSVDILDLVEVDAEGRRTTLVVFDPDGIEAAYAELERRYQSGEGATNGILPASYYLWTIDATNRRDWEALAGSLAPGFRLDDHHVLGWGDTLNDAAAFVRAQQAFVELSPDVHYYLDHVRRRDRATITQFRQSGTREGGEFETPMLACFEADAEGRVQRFDTFSPEQCEEAYARFEELGLAAGSSRPLAKVEVFEQKLRETATPGSDIERIREIVTPDFRYEDRQKRSLVTGGVDTWLASIRFVTSLPNVDIAFTPVATIGDRLLLQHMTWKGGPQGEGFDMEWLRLVEIDEDDRIRRSILFDADDRAAAFAEAHALFLAGEGGECGGQAPYVSMMDAYARNDWDTMRDCLSADLEFKDHRRLGLGELGREQWVESTRALAKLAPDLQGEPVRYLAWDRNGCVVSLRQAGTVPDGGGPFENVFVSLYITDDRCITHVEVFDIEDGDRAVARFEELGAAKDRSRAAR